MIFSGEKGGFYGGETGILSTKHAYPVTLRFDTNSNFNLLKSTRGREGK